MILVLSTYGKEDDSVAAMEENKKERKKDIIMQYPLSATARQFKREEQLLRSAKQRYKDLRRIIDNNVKLFENAENKRNKLKRELDQKLSQNPYFSDLKCLENKLNACLHINKDPKKQAKCRRTFNKNKHHLDRKHNILPIYNRFSAADRVLESLKRQQIALSKEFRQLGKEIEHRNKRSNDLFEKTPKMPLSRQDVRECIEKVLK